MKKTYIAPNQYVVKLHVKNCILEGSVHNEVGDISDGSQLVKEDVSLESDPITTKSLWDETW